MDETDFTDLYDSIWFGMQNLKTSRRSFSTSDSPPDSPTLAGMYLQQSPAKLETVSTMLRSVSEDFLYTKPGFNSGDASPDSVLCTILSGKEFTESAEELTISSPPLPPKSKSKATAARRRRAKKESGGPASKSLSSLEFEELKGFMDLGFVFSEKDKESSLVSILPGLQRLGKNEEESAAEDESAVARPYLSEAWAVQEEEKRRKKIAVTNWRVPARGNEVDMKDSLRLWAQTVASTVR
ncbi:hypothetical protein LINPERPRIM_LOCUS18386 [Linum perenne]